MSYPGRPPIVPGITVPPGMAYIPMTGPPPLMPQVMPMQHVSYMCFFDENRVCLCVIL